MRKIIISLMLVLIILTGIASYTYIKNEDTKIRETTNMPSGSYSLVNSDNAVIETKYNFSDAGIIKVITTYEFKNNNLVGVKQETHYINNESAKIAVKLKFDDVTMSRNNNIVTAILTNDSFGGTMQELIAKIEEADKMLSKVNPE